MTIYKYFNPDCIEILENSLIRFTQPSIFNDPFECFPYLQEITHVKHVQRVREYLNRHKCSDAEKEGMFLASWKEEHEKHPELNVSYEEFREFLKFKMDAIASLIGDLKKGHGSVDLPSFRRKVVQVMMQIINRVGILCLTEKMDNLLMWAHYSSNHTGFVIEFDEKHTFFGQGRELGSLKKVRYSTTRPEVTMLDPTLSDIELLYKWIEDIFCVKSKHWEYEQEWRMIVPLRGCQSVIASQQGDIYLFELPKSCITGIILGCRMSGQNKERILNALRNDEGYNHVSLRQAEMDEKEFRLSITDISLTA